VGQSTRFDASASTDPHGTIASYRWEFGDGATETATSPLATHAYGAPGTYSARVTLTDDEGCSTTFVFTGQTAYCNGSARATAVVPVTVAAPAGRPLPGLVAPVVSALRARSKCVSRAVLAGAPTSGSGGLAFTYMLNEPASVLYVVKRRDATAGRRACGPAPGRAPGSYSDVGSLGGSGGAGANGVSVGTSARASGRGRGPVTRLQVSRAGLRAGRHGVTLAQIAQGKQLAPGTYVLLVRARNAAGQRSNDALVKFFVTRG
jgi:hypothetical protein